MKEYKIENWTDFWNCFDVLIELLYSNNQTNIVSDLKDAQKCVNGLTDGWYDFLAAFEKTIIIHKRKLTEEQMNISYFLIGALNKTLTMR